MIKRKKEEISRIRKKKFMAEKSLMNMEKNNGSVFALKKSDIRSTNCSSTTHSNTTVVSLKEEYS